MIQISCRVNNAKAEMHMHSLSMFHKTYSVFSGFLRPGATAASLIYLGTRVSDRTLAREVALQAEHAAPAYGGMLFSATRIYRRNWWIRLQS